MQLHSFLILFLMIVSLKLCLVQSQGGIPGNNGPIFYTVRNYYCQELLSPHYPVYLDWINGDWTLSYLYQQAPRAPITCAGVRITGQTLNKQINARFVMVNTTFTKPTASANVTDSRISPSRWITNCDRGLIAESSQFFHPVTMLITFLGFTTNVAVDERNTYISALYAASYEHVQSGGVGTCSISEVGILTRNGSIAATHLEHYNRLIYDNGVLPPEKQLLRIPDYNC